MQVYLIRNKVNGKAYVGQTTRNIDQRWREHCLTQGKCRILENAIRKYGAAAFEVSVVATVKTQEELNRLERLTCEALNTYAPHGYNLREGGGAKGRMHEQTKQIMRELALRPERVDAFVAMRYRQDVMAKMQEHRIRNGKKIASWMRAGRTPESEIRRRENVTKTWQTESVRMAQSERQRLIQARPELKSKKAARLKAYWDSLTDEQRKARGAAVSAGATGVKKTVDYSPEAKEARRQIALKRAEDPVWREKNAKHLGRLVADPEFRKRRGEAIRAALAAKNAADPGFLKRRAAAAVANRKAKE